jgi:hypothetical protein
MSKVVVNLHRSEGGAIGGPRLSIASLMTLVGVIALDCATLVQAAGSLEMAIFLLVVVLPMINIGGIGMLLLLQPTPRR